MKVTKADLLAPANAITALGILLSVTGAVQLNTARGFVLVAVGKVLDLLDGFVARRTHTSRFGAIFDATADKCTIAVLLFAVYHFKLVPSLFLLFVLSYNVLVAGISIAAEARGMSATPTQLSKKTMFVHIGALLSFSLAQIVTSGQRALHDTSTVIALIGIAMGIASLASYGARYGNVLFAKSHK